MSNAIAITGNTFSVKDQLRAMGGKWNADKKAWMVPAEKADEAKALVDAAPKPVYAKTEYPKYTGRTRSYGNGYVNDGSDARSFARLPRY